jgi:hypothetical protein
VTFAQAPPALGVPVSSGAGSFGLPAGLFAGTVALPTSLFTGVSLISGFTVALSNQAMAFTAAGGPLTPGGRPRAVPPSTLLQTGPRGAGGGFGGPGPLAGAALVNVLGLFNLNIPLAAVGVTSGASRTTSAAVVVTALGTGWTTGVATVTGVSQATPGGGFVNTVTFAGYDNRSAGHAGVVQLVSPFRVVTGVAGNLAGLATLRLVFLQAPVPEPETALLLAVAAAFAARAGLRRRRTR